MRAVYYEAFGQMPWLANLPDPTPTPDGVVLAVRATGLCRSDWHAWMGHDPDIRLPHVPGHELAGEVVAVGARVTRWRIGDRVTVPFVCACGVCPQCQAGQQQVCDHQFQPGFTHWGSFAEYVAIDRADLNLVRLPDDMTYVTAASLGCRFATAFRAVVDLAKVSAGEWVAVYGCGGVGLSAIMLAHALGGQVIGIDINPERLALARDLGAVAVVNAATEADVVGVVRELSRGGVHIAIDALGSPTTCANAIASLRKRGRHVQVGLLLAEQRMPPLPMDIVVARELVIMGSHGMQAHRYDAMLDLIQSGKVQPQRLIGRTIRLDEAPVALVDLDSFRGAGVTVITEF
ncbi:zinc-dependent alcohol dehydrogenase family protein [Chloroflexus aggregans]|uniref:Alcohol dehydrogenase zinc-binding domain protein n=1 Tax=Chloroflexus aggregans (strain MD-66 / DSM 9485) TaxID=326427 RepID=B8GAN0_CHLAD|nr:zinc-dependent alcohol dehydrogenase family protein [Chloroflexus aggregans]ACL24619.1 Alcohol dehydrogenase zinc-binding domain protein [Chloroflexus aggregans DSM 9485]